MGYTTKAIYLKAPAVRTPELNDAINPLLEDWLQKHALEDGKQLYHYTDLNGLKGILNKRGLWLSHISTLNDPLELNYGRKLVLDELNDRMVNEEDSYIRRFYNSIKENVNSFGNILHQPFIACFCEKKSLLSQWRAYSNNGGGYSIGIEIKDSSLIAFDKKNLENGYKPVLRKIIYNPDEQLKLIKDVFDKMTSGYKEGIEGEVSGTIDKGYLSSVMGIQAVNFLLDFILSFKNPAFEEEQEWRLIHVGLKGHKPENFKFRENNDGLIPYQQSYLFNKKDEDVTATFPIKSIHIGPSLDQDSQKTAIELYLRHSSTKKDNIQIFKPGLISVENAGYELR